MQLLGAVMELNRQSDTKSNASKTDDGVTICSRLCSLCDLIAIECGSTQYTSDLYAQYFCFREVLTYLGTTVLHS